MIMKKAIWAALLLPLMAAAQPRLNSEGNWVWGTLEISGRTNVIYWGGEWLMVTDFFRVSGWYIGPPYLDLKIHHAVLENVPQCAVGSKAYFWPRDVGASAETVDPIQVSGGPQLLPCKGETRTSVYVDLGPDNQNFSMRYFGASDFRDFWEPCPGPKWPCGCANSSNLIRPQVSLWVVELFPKTR